MRRIVLSILFFTLFVYASTAQKYSVAGVVIDGQSEKKMADVKVICKSKQNPENKPNYYKEIKTEPDGSFLFFELEKGSYSIEFENKGYKKQVVKFSLTEDKNLGKIKIYGIDFYDDAGAFDDIIMDDDEGGISSMPALLHGSRDVFLSVAGYQWGPMRFRVRGYEGNYSRVYMNGLYMNEPESGRGTWYLWSGLNDVTRNKHVIGGLKPSSFAIGEVGGTQNISTRPAEQREGTKITYSNVKGNYNHRVMVTHSTGLMENGWAFTVSGSKRWAEEGYVEGTFYDAYGYFVGIEKKINDKHSIAITGMGTPSTRGGRTASTQEVYDLVGSNYYNPTWGWQNGEKRNSRVRTTHKPLFTLNHYWTINETTTLTTGVSYLFGKSSSTSLNWYNANDPRPDYYRYLPSYFTDDSLAAATRTLEFQNGDRQLLWDKMYEANLGAIDTVFNANNTGENLIGYKSEYIIENRIDDVQQYGANTVFEKDINDNYILIAGAMYRGYKGNHYKTINDLLGGDFVVDIDKYAERDFPDPETAQNDIRFPNRIVKVGDKFGYDYDANIHYGELWLQNKFSFKYIDFYLSGQGSYTSFWRTGYMQNGKFPNNSLGDSKKYNFIDYDAKAGVIFKIDGRNYVTINGSHMTKAPNFRNAFVSSRIRDEVIDGLKSEKIMSFDASYLLRSPKVKASITAFYTDFKDQVWVRSFYHDGYRNFVNYALTGINKTHQGVEFGLVANVTSTISLSTAGSFSYNRWVSNPTYSVSVDNSSESLAENETVYAKGFLVSGSPQTIYSVGINYRAPKHWYFNFNRNSMEDNYLSFNPTRRTETAVEGLDLDGQQVYDITAQEQLAKAVVYNISIGKSFNFNYKYYLSINFSVNNLFDNQDFVTGGYEQLRYDLQNKEPEKFQPKYYYYYGRTYYLNVNFRF